MTLLFPTLFFAAGLAGGAMGYRREGVWLREGRLTLRRQRGIYLHSICVFHPDICLTARQSPWAVNADRTDLTVAFPGFVRLTVRSIRGGTHRNVLNFWKEVESYDKNDPF